MLPIILLAFSIPPHLQARADAADLLAYSLHHAEASPTPVPTPKPSPSPSPGRESDIHKAELEIEAAGAKAGWVESTLVKVAGTVVDQQLGKAGLAPADLRQIGDGVKSLNDAFAALRKPRTMEQLTALADAQPDKLVYMFSGGTWCEPCNQAKKILPLLDDSDRRRIVVIDTDKPIPREAFDVWEKITDKRIPQFVVVDQGKVVAATVPGAPKNAEALTNWLRANK